VTKIIKRGREELNTKRIEYTQKKEELETKWRFLREEEKEVKEKIDSHQLLVNSVDKFKAELVKVNLLCSFIYLESNRNYRSENELRFR